MAYLFVSRNLLIRQKLLNCQKPFHIIIGSGREFTVFSKIHSSTSSIRISKQGTSCWMSR
ncbi:hypothetical protein EJ110_NYTH10953 [Nymphaea thermarum]|nr:hypothetical protein EJ110_NYTH10953 [Nymphaea thermarum]